MASVKHLSGTALAKWWLGDHAIGLGFFLAIAPVGVLGMVLAPMGPVDHVIGRIEGFLTKQAEFGSFPVAVVDLPSTTVAVQCLARPAAESETPCTCSGGILFTA